MEAEEKEKLLDRQHELLFHVGRSVRYHDRRRAFFEALHRISSVFVVLLASSVFLDLLGSASERPWWITGIALMAAIFAAFDIIVGFSRFATLHHDLKRRFIQLEIEISTQDVTQQNLRSQQAECLRIEQDEPPVYRALDLLCHNELAHAKGYTDKAHFFTVDPWPRFTRHFYHWANLTQNGKPQTPVKSQ